MQKTKIVKFKVTDDGAEVTYSKTVRRNEDELYTSEVSEICSWKAHPDLLATLDKLRPHMMLLAELDAEENFSYTHEEGGLFNVNQTKFKVTGFSIGGSGETEGVTLVGRKNLKTKKVFNIVAPFTKWEEEEPYEYADDLQHILFEEVYPEILAYLDGKKDRGGQLSLDLKPLQVEYAK